MRRSTRLSPAFVALLLVTAAPPAFATGPTTSDRPSAAVVSSTQPAAMPNAAQAKTYTLEVDGCEGCTITAYRKKGGDYYAPIVGNPAQVVTRRTVKFRFKPSWTVRFEIDDPTRQNPWFITEIVMRYKGKKTGSRVTPDFAGKAGKATVLWKVPKKKATLRVRVDDLGRVWDDDIDRWCHYFRAYSVKTQPKRGGWRSLGAEGVAGNQGYS